MANPKRYAGGGGGEVRCAIHRGTPQEKWLRTRDVTEDLVGNLKEAMKLLQDENTASVTTTGLPSLQATESKRKAAIKKALNKLVRALNQVSTVELYTADLNQDMHNLQKKLDASEKAQMELSEQMETSTTKMQEQAEYYKAKMQETLNKLEREEDLMAKMVKELEATRLAVQQLKGSEQGNNSEEHLKFAASEETLRTENEKLKRQFLSAVKEKETVEMTTKVALKSALANVERYKEVVAKVTADNMIFLMKLKHSEAALNSSQGRLGELQKEIDTGRAQWLDEASAEIQEVIRSSLSKAEACEAKLQVLQRRLGKIDEEWEEKLLAATEKLAQATSSRDWFEKKLVEASEKCRVLEEEKAKLLQRYEDECRYRQQAEAESRALISTLRKTNEELAELNLELGTAIKETEAQKCCVVEKEKEIKKLLSDLDESKCQLETQQAVNAAIMKKKEEVEWELMAVEAQRAKLHQNLNDRLSKSHGRTSPLSSFL